MEDIRAEAVPQAAGRSNRRRTLTSRQVEFEPTDEIKDFRAVFRLPDPDIRKSYVYFLYGAGHVKIGYANDPLRRLKELKMGLPWDSHMVLLVEGGKTREQFLHFVFREDHASGEWFRLSPNLERTLRQFGDQNCIEWLDKAMASYRKWVREEAERLGLLVAPICAEGTTQRVQEMFS